MKVLVVIILAFLGNALVYTAIEFVNGKLYIGRLPLYQWTTDNIRLFIMMPTLFLLANYLLKSSFEIPGVKASWVSAAVFGTLAIVFYIDNILRGEKPGEWTTIAACFMIISSIGYGISFR